MTFDRLCFRASAANSVDKVHLVWRKPTWSCKIGR